MRRTRRVTTREVEIEIETADVTFPAALQAISPAIEELMHVPSLEDFIEFNRLMLPNQNPRRIIDVPASPQRSIPFHPSR